MKLHSKIKLLLSLIVIGAIFSGSQAAYAQEASEGPVYIVQAGDTLYSIALRFGVAMEDLIQANQIGNANQLFVGEELVVPGLTGVVGFLQTVTIPYGDNLRSLSRKYQIDPAQLSRINRLVSPAELLVGSTLILPVNSDSRQAGSRTLMQTGQTPLELSVIAGQNPWELAARNQIAAPALLLPGDVLYTPGDKSDGPGALPGVVEAVEITTPIQGQTVEIRVKTAADLTLAGTFGPYPLHFFPTADGFVALQGIHPLADPGLAQISLDMKIDDPPTTFSFAQNILIEPGSFYFEKIVVPPEFLDPEASDREWEILKPIYESVSPHRYWQGVFSAPSPYPGCINSSFGNRRSYNGSAFTYYHSGVDFCGGMGAEITAAAAGKVVFADLTEIRGNLTIIDHGWGVFTSYMHQSEVFVEVGDEVQAGQVIGLVGSTGRSTGSHLHWEVWVGGVPVNPLDWLSALYP